jgi:hypothetical protein
MRKFAKVVIYFFAYVGAAEVLQAFVFGVKNHEDVNQMTPKERVNAYYASRIS